MIFNRQEIFSKFPWLIKKKTPMIISANYDGLICANLLHHLFQWELVGYYDQESIWISDNAIKSKKDIIWVDLNILPKQGRAIGGHIISVDGEIPQGFSSSCNPNILYNLTCNDFHAKFPFSTLIFLLWLHNISLPQSILARLLILHSDASWLKYQHYQPNCETWISQLGDYKWKEILFDVNTKAFEKKIDQILYPSLSLINAFSGYSKLKSKILNIRSREIVFNPDWDEDIILKLSELISNTLLWTPPSLPMIIKRIDGEKYKISVSDVKKIGLDDIIKKKKIFSYAITSPRVFSYTTFGDTKRTLLS